MVCCVPGSTKCRQEENWLSESSDLKVLTCINSFCNLSGNLYRVLDYTSGCEMVSMGHSSSILQAHPVLSGLRLEVLRAQGKGTTSGSLKFSRGDAGVGWSVALRGRTSSVHGTERKPVPVVSRAGPASDLAGCRARCTGSLLLSWLLLQHLRTVRLLVISVAG